MKGGKKDWESWIDQQIREAEERGAFKDLPGKGKPLDTTPNPYAGDQELAFKVLRDAGYAPEWIELDKAIRVKLERLRLSLGRAWESHQAHLGELAGRSDRWAEAERNRTQAGWHDAIAAFERDVGSVNREIAELNLKVPAPRFQRAKVDVTKEVRRLVEGGS
jgi:DnaJ family protein C protein 28